MARQLNSWLKGLQAYVENTEAPRQFWLWGGVSTIASALQRKVWLPFGIETQYPNLYVLIVGPPASRKALPIVLSKNMLLEIQVPVSRDSGSKRDFTKGLAETGKTEIFTYEGVRHSQCSISVISKEMSSLLAVNPKEMIEVLTDLYDCHNKWDYGTAGQGEDVLYNVIANCLIGSTPTWIAANLPQESIGGGYTSRHVIVWGDQVYKRVALPEITEQQEKLYKTLVSDLGHINRLVGEFTWDPEARKFFKNWYKNIDDKIVQTPDDRLHPFIGRMHTIALKTAMCLRVDYSDELIITPDVIQEAIKMVETILVTASEAFGGHGRSRMGIDVNRVIGQMKMLKQTQGRDLLRLNYKHLTLSELKEVLQTIEGMGLIRIEFDTNKGENIITYLGKKGDRI